MYVRPGTVTVTAGAACVTVVVGRTVTLMVSFSVAVEVVGGRVLVVVVDEVLVTV